MLCTVSAWLFTLHHQQQLSVYQSCTQPAVITQLTLSAVSKTSPTRRLPRGCSQCQIYPVPVCISDMWL